MKEINLKRPIQLPDENKTILKAGKYVVGVLPLTDEIFSHWFLQGLVKSGNIIVLGNVTSSFTSSKNIVEPESEDVYTEELDDEGKGSVEDVKSDPNVKFEKSESKEEGDDVDNEEINSKLKFEKFKSKKIKRTKQDD